MTLHDWIKKHKIDTGMRNGASAAEREGIKALERENKELLTIPVRLAGATGISHGFSAARTPG
jgi:hypothetical protein